jgi:drug/metabolite transporter (DMT)-like permease
MSKNRALPGSRLAPGLAQILMAVCLWGGIPFVTSSLARQVFPGELVVMRMLLAGGVLVALGGPRRFWRALWANPIAFLALSAVGFALPNLLYVYALRTPSSIAMLSFVANSYPVWAIALAVIFLRERLSAYLLIAVGCTIAGIALMSGLGPGSAGGLPPGVLLMLVASLGWGSATVVSKKLSATVDSAVIAAGRHVLSGILLCPVILVEGTRFARASAGTWLLMGLLVAMSVVSYWLYYRGLAHTSVARASLVEAFAPVVTWAMGVLAFGQGLTGPQAVAAVLILTGLLLAAASDVRPRRAPAPQAGASPFGPR